VSSDVLSGLHSSRPDRFTGSTVCRGEHIAIGPINFARNLDEVNLGSFLLTENSSLLEEAIYIPELSPAS